MDSKLRIVKVGAGRFLRLTLFCVACVVGAIIAAVYVIPTFGDPAPNYANLGQIQVAVATTDAPGKPSSFSSPVYIESYFSQARSDTAYVVNFPEQYVGQRFVVLLAGSAVLDNSWPPTTEGRIESAPCSATGSSQYGWQEEQLPACQAFFGTVPASSPRPLVDYDCGDQADPSTIRVTLSGMSQTSFDMDLVHHTTKLPDYEPYRGGWQYRETFDSYFGLDLGRTYAPLRQGGCKLLLPNSDWKVDSVTQDPTKTTKDGWLNWRGDDSSHPTVVVSKDRDAGGFSNGLLALAGVLAGLGVGFMPVAYDAWREWYGYRRSVRPPDQPSSKAVRWQLGKLIKVIPWQRLWRQLSGRIEA